MDMRDDDVGVRELPVDWDDCKTPRPLSPPIVKFNEERGRELHRGGKSYLSAPHSRDPVEDFDPGRHSNQCAACGEKDIHIVSHARGEHMVSPDGETEERNGNR